MRQDALSEIFDGGLRETPAPERAAFEEACTQCRGSGKFVGRSGRVIGNCFKCKGKGKLTFTTSPQARASARASRAGSKLEKIEAFKAEHPAIWEWMQGNTFSFAISLAEALNKYGYLTDNQEAAAYRCIAKRDAARATAAAEQAARTAAAPAVSTTKLEEAFERARTAPIPSRATRKAPILRVAGLRFTNAKETSANPGAIYVTRSDRTYLGKIIAGKFQRVRDCSEDEAANVVKVCEDPKAAAVAYGFATGSCSVCGRELTDPESIQNGIGPVCATRWGW